MQVAVCALSALVQSCDKLTDPSQITHIKLLLAFFKEMKTSDVHVDHNQT